MDLIYFHTKPVRIKAARIPHVIFSRDYCLICNHFENDATYFSFFMYNGFIGQRVKFLMKAYADISELINNLETEIQSLSHTITTLKKTPSSVNEQIILKYIDTGSTGKTKDFVRSLDIMSERGTLFSSGDVTKLIKLGADDISTDLLDIAQKVVNIKKR